ncbi:MAG: TonB-dependent receptor plug domain-containing protein [Fibrobacter sp.]|nr:TonB-dependent receptor plug domain-containing protein [Fibrobacter sp.]
MAVSFAFASADSEPDSVFRDLGSSDVRAHTLQSFPDFSFFEIHSEAWAGRNVEISDILAEVAGVESYKQGGMGAFQSVSIRGIAAKGILICIDGVPLENAGGGAMNLSYIDLNQIEKIEIYKGYIPARFGGNGMGGAINFVSKNSVQTKGEFEIGYGNFNTQKISGFFSAPLTDSLRFNTSLSYRRSDNNFRFFNRNGTPYNTEDDRWEERKNADFSQISGTHSLEKIFANSILSRFTVSHSEEAGGNPGRESNQTVVAGFKRNFVQGILFSDFPLFRALSLSAQVTARAEKSSAHSYYPLDKIGYAHPGFLEYGVFQTSLYPEISLDIHPGVSWNANFYFRGFLDYLEPRDSQKITSKLKWELKRTSGEAAFDFSKKFSSYFIWNADVSARFIRDQFYGGILQTPTQQDTIPASKETNFFPSARTAAVTAFAKSLQGFASVGYYERAPQVMERYGVYQNVLPNPELKAESGWNYELGLMIKTPSENHSLQISLFETRLKNGIVWYTANSFSKPLNLSESKTQGVELNLQTKPFSFLEGGIQGSLQNPKDLSAGIYRQKQLAGEPRYSFAAETRLFLPFHLSFTWKTHYRSKVFNDRANRQSIPAAFTHFSSLAWELFPKSKMEVSVQNILNETHQNIYAAYPQPGRQFFASFSQCF